MLRPQAFGTDSDGIGSCAFGAAREAIGISFIKDDDDCENDDRQKIWDIWPIMAMTLKCPECGVSMFAATVVSHHLNDNHRWTRERIADWVETIENQQAATSTLVIERSEPTAKASRD